MNTPNDIKHLSFSIVIITALLLLMVYLLVFIPLPAHAVSWFGTHAKSTPYSNTTSGLTATNVQAAIDEVYAAISTPTAFSISSMSLIDTTTSGTFDSHYVVWTSGGVNYTQTGENMVDWLTQELSISAGAPTDATYLTSTLNETLSAENVVSANGLALVTAADFATMRSSLGLGSMATQANNSVNIDGGAIDGTTIGANSAAASTFTTCTASSFVSSAADGAHYLDIVNGVAISATAGAGRLAYYNGYFWISDADDWVTNYLIANTSFSGNTENGITVTPQSDGTVDFEIEFTAGADGMSDDTYSGKVISGRAAGETLTQWDMVFLAADGKWDQADADATGEFPSWGMAVVAATDGLVIDVLTEGIVRNDGWAWNTTGGPVYLSDTAGGLTETAPSTASDCVHLVGRVLSDDEVYINVDLHYVTVPAE